MRQSQSGLAFCTCSLCGNIGLYLRLCTDRHLTVSVRLHATTNNQRNSSIRLRINTNYNAIPSHAFFLPMTNLLSILPVRVDSLHSLDRSRFFSLVLFRLSICMVFTHQNNTSHTCSPLRFMSFFR